MTVWVKFDEKDGSKVMLGTQWLGTMWKSGLSDSYAVKCRLHSCSHMVSIKVRHWDDVNCQNIFLSSTGTPIPHILHLTRLCSLHHACLSRRTHPVCARAKRTVSSARCLADHGVDAPTKVFEWFFCGLSMTGSFGHRDHRRLWESSDYFPPVAKPKAKAKPRAKAKQSAVEAAPAPGPAGPASASGA